MNGAGTGRNTPASGNSDRPWSATLHVRRTLKTCPKLGLVKSGTARDDSVVVATLVCTECYSVADGNRGWEAHLADVNDDGADELVFFCPTCAKREFGTELQR